MSIFRGSDGTVVITNNHGAVIVLSYDEAVSLYNALKEQYGYKDDDDDDDND